MNPLHWYKTKKFEAKSASAFINLTQHSSFCLMLQCNSVFTTECTHIPSWAPNPTDSCLDFYLSTDKYFYLSTDKYKRHNRTICTHQVQTFSHQVWKSNKREYCDGGLFIWLQSDGYGCILIGHILATNDIGYLYIWPDVCGESSMNNYTTFTF